jgi:hypothetical protein
MENKTPFDSPSLRRYLIDKIDRIPEVYGARVIYFDGVRVHELRPHPPVCQPNYLTVVIRSVDPSDIQAIAHPTPHAKNQDGRFYTELLATSLSCGAAALSWVVLGGSGAAVPVTGGASATITVLTYSAAVASSIQCGNSFVRMVNESQYGDPELNRRLDSQEWYNQTLTALDVVSVTGAAAAAGVTLKMVMQLNKSGTSITQVLKGLSRQERKALTEDIIRVNNPGISNKALKALVAAGTYPKRFGKVELSNTARLQLKDALSATLSFVGSATGGVIRDPSKIKDFALAVFEEFEVIE